MQACGEALVDLVASPSGSVDAVVGGSVFTTSRALGRLEVPVAYAGAVSTDRFGAQMCDALVTDGVMIDGVRRVEAPTTLALAEVDDSGAAEYRFYIDGTSAPIGVGVLDVIAPVMFTGGLGLVLEPMATDVAAAITSAAVAGRAVMVDVNARPALISDPDAFRQRVNTLISSCWVVKVSDDDLAILAPGVDAVTAARGLIAHGAQSVLLTRGADRVGVYTADDTAEIDVPAVPVIDTIGAGDTFDAGFLSWWYRHHPSGPTPHPDIDDLCAASRAGIAAAAVTVGRRGADPPRLDEIEMDER